MDFSIELGFTFLIVFFEGGEEGEVFLRVIGVRVWRGFLLGYGERCF